MSDRPWIPVSERKPPMQKVVETKFAMLPDVFIEQPLFLGSGQLWYEPESREVVHYEPTHWRKML